MPVKLYRGIRVCHSRGQIFKFDEILLGRDAPTVNPLGRPMGRDASVGGRDA